MKKKYLLLLSLFALLPLGTIVTVHAPLGAPSAPTNPTISTLPSPLSLSLLSANIAGCSQMANINASWTGGGFYPISPASFYLIIRQPNAIYGNTTDFAQANNTPSQWFLFSGTPITLRISFQLCANIQFEALFYSDGQFSAKLA